MAGITTHVLDTAAGRPVAGVRIVLHRDDAVLFEGTTDHDGRARLAERADAGIYRLTFDTGAYTNRLGLDVRADRLAALTGTLAGIGAPLHAWYGVRVFTDLAADDAPVPDDVEALLAAEERAGRTDPYRGVAALLHLCGVRG